MKPANIEFLAELEGIIASRTTAPATESYTAQLLQSGTRRVAQKVGEEAVELGLASVAGSRQEQCDEAADLVYHLLVLLNCNGLSLADIVAVLEARHRP